MMYPSNRCIDIFTIYYILIYVLDILCVLYVFYSMFLYIMDLFHFFTDSIYIWYTYYTILYKNSYSNLCSKHDTHNILTDGFD